MSMPKSGRGAVVAAHLALLHPGPSALCTTVTLLAGASVRATTPPALRPSASWRWRLLAAGLSMSLLQISTGCLNDAFDAPWDGRWQAYKPVPRGLVPRRRAWLLGFGAGAGGVLVAALAGARAARLALLGLASGWSYSLGLSRTPLSVLPFATGLGSVPLLGAAALRLRPAQPVRMAALGAWLGTALHLANSGPDAERDRMAGRRSLAVLLGAERCHRLARWLLLAGAAEGMREAGRRRSLTTLAGAASCLMTVGLEWRRQPRQRRPGSHPFVLPALGAGALAAGWLLGQPEVPGTRS